MPRAPRLTGKRILSLLRKRGFDIIRVKGSHFFIRHPDGRCTVVVVHAGEIIGPGLLHAVLEDTELTINELLNPERRT